MAVLKSFSVFRKETLPYLTKIDYNKKEYTVKCAETFRLGSMHALKMRELAPQNDQR